MASGSDFVARDLRQLRLETEDEGNTRKRKKDSCSHKANSKRTRAILHEKNTQMSVQTLCTTEGGISAFSRIETRSQKQLKVLKEQTSNNGTPERRKTASFTFTNFFIPVVKSVTPLPELDWADPKEVWSIMLQKDRKYYRDPLYFRKHSFIQPKMRAILLDWLTEVCEVYRLHRESYHLAVDFIDRYLSGKDNVAKQRLQLIGTTALFIAAKIEEIYPPKVSEFAYVTDGACTENEILDEELLMLKESEDFHHAWDASEGPRTNKPSFGLNWNLSPITVNSWLNIYMQLSCLATQKRKPDLDFVIPRYRQQEFVQVMQLLDLCTLDVGFLQFSYSILAASALYQMLPVTIQEVTGHTWDELWPCIQWMRCFAEVTRQKGVLRLSSFDQVACEDAHNIQTHAVDLNLLDKALALQGVQSRSASPVLAVFNPPTPPSSTKKNSR